LTKIVAAEEMQNNIRASVISPGRINTPYLDRIPETLTDEYRQRILQPEDVASVVLFVARLPHRVQIPEIFMVSAEDKGIH
jgi:NADP-dependent 3-hydroxy acid dehydrogenase YdfG